MVNNNESIEETIKKLEEEDEIFFKKWNDDILSKLILIFPTLIFVVTFLKINSDKSILDLFIFIGLGSILAIAGVILNFLMSRK